MTDKEIESLTESLHELGGHHDGEAILFDWITHVQDQVLSRTSSVHVDNEVILEKIKDYDRKMVGKEFASAIHNCSICLTDLLGKEFTELQSCSHSFCRACLAQYCENHIKDGSSRMIKCPDPECSLMVEINVVKHLVHKELFERYDRNLVERVIRSMSGSVWCPVLECQQPAQVISEEPHLGKIVI